MGSRLTFGKSLFHVYLPSLSLHVINLRVVNSMGEYIWGSSDVGGSSPTLRGQSGNRHCHLENMDHSRNSGETYCHRYTTIESENREPPSSSSQVMAWGDDRTGSKGSAGVLGEQQPSTEILRLFHDAFPDICLTEDACTVSSTKGSKFWHDCPQHESVGTARQIPRSCSSSRSVACRALDHLFDAPYWATVIGDDVSWADLAEQQHDEYEVKPRGEGKLLLWSNVGWYYTCSPAA